MDTPAAHHAHALSLLPDHPREALPHAEYAAANLPPHLRYLAQKTLARIARLLAERSPLRR